MKSWLKTKTRRPSIVPWPGHDAVAQDVLLVEPEVSRPVRDERVELDERARVEEQVESLARGQLAPRVLALDADRSPTELRLPAHPLQALEALFAGRHGDLLAVAWGAESEPAELSLRRDMAARPLSS